MYIANNFNWVAVGNSVPTATKIGDGTNGDLAVVAPDGTVLTKSTVTDYDDIRIAYKREGKTYYSPKIGTDLQVYQASSHSTPVQQVTTIGYDGSTAQHALLNANLSAGDEYGIVLQRKQDPVGITNSAYYYDTPLYHVVQEGAEYEVDVIDGLAALIGNRIADGRGTNKWLKVERLVNPNSGSVSPIVGAGDVTVVKYNKEVTFATTTTGKALDVGAYLILEDVAYKITANNESAKIVTLDQPYMGDSGTVLAANTDTLTRAGAIDDDTEWGLKFTGEDLYFEDMTFQDSIVRFGITMVGDWTDTSKNTLTTGTAANSGLGSYEEVAQSESEHYAAQVMHDPYDLIKNPRGEFNATSSNTYDYCSLQFKETKGSLHSSNTNQLFQIELWLKVNTFDSTTTGADDNGVVEVLDAWYSDKLSGTYNQDSNLT